MSSKWKPKVIFSYFLYRRSISFRSKRKGFFVGRNYKISESNVNKFFFVYNGREYTNILANEKMLGHSFGEFSCTKKRGALIHGQNKLKAGSLINVKKKKRG